VTISATGASQADGTLKALLGSGTMVASRAASSFKEFGCAHRQVLALCSLLWSGISQGAGCTALSGAGRSSFSRTGSASLTRSSREQMCLRVWPF